MYKHNGGIKAGRGDTEGYYYKVLNTLYKVLST